MAKIDEVKEKLAAMRVWISWLLAGTAGIGSWIVLDYGGSAVTFIACIALVCIIVILVLINLSYFKLARSLRDL